ncbi:MAG: F0F1 ATP synthase subunit B [Hyphomicrobium sp.]|uniref:F0F1 ATP synthase subunit B family protein n=1 Tax=Hyphomicrobium sp. CS1BSMeth3 TaxID=1892844 RepID=UPI00086BC7BE|nr:F0F1 ATP synthase subunit B [Hyphomicrobium sp. CS1BSMeth3]MBN9260255.1 F0F1 ATP synthase subunit B [Hyphomicrobium sp.]ODT30215.1 MAG: F0F1 ATP synthase subunit B [Hyphomicrobium sp. SCN 65-11]OJU27794.1 MAG: F0F1 ATP synthase subunit B [Alphaproteobacteria bacterium 64-6]MBN9264770.1 F0F1 ATP synthase subunit B [Hyphomicrobium sp.]MBN9276840.1 F0F1 ATP synthase subunit B [Hyphomicrobium sp.]
MFFNPEFWVAIAFFAFVGVLVKMGVPSMITKSLDDRADAVRKELDQARRLREEAQDLLADYQRKQRAADEEARAIIETARREAEAMKAESARSLKEQLERRTRLAEDKIARAEAQAVSEVRAAAVDIAMSAAERLIGDKLKTDGGADLVNRSIRDLKGKLN